ncbi:MAG: response regulator transcription factor [Gemmatimonadales bacterium]
MSRILIVEDNASIANGVRKNLEIEGYSVDIALNGEEALEMIRRAPPNLVILDLMLPKLDGYHVLRIVRDEEYEMPVLILSARGDEADKVRGFRIGADDYLTKPFSVLELIARVDALFRRGRKMSEQKLPPLSEPISFGDIEVDPARFSVRRAGVRIPLRPKEFELLVALLRHRDEVVPRATLLEEVWGYESEVVTRTVDTHVMELRRKLEADPANPKHILTVRKAGYRLALGID